MAAAKTKKRKQKIKQNIKYELYGILMIAFFVIVLSKMGTIGMLLYFFFRMLFGSLYSVVSLMGIIIALYMMVKRTLPLPVTMRKLGIFFILLASLLYAQADYVNDLNFNGQYTDANMLKVTWQDLSRERVLVNEAKSLGDSIPEIEVGGGMVGAITYEIFNFLFGEGNDDQKGLDFIIFTFYLVGVLLAFQFSYVNLLKRIKKSVLNFISKFKVKVKEMFVLAKEEKDNSKPNYKSEQYKQDEITFSINDNEEPIIHDFLDRTQASISVHQELPNNNFKAKTNIKVDKEEIDDTHDINLKGVSIDKFKEEEENYLLPPFKILNRPNIVDQGNELRGITNNAKKLETTLESFGVKAKVTQINRGPAVTRYEIQPDIGVKVSRIVNLSDDIALSLAAKDIRIEAPIPGKAAIGIEVPNEKIAIVTLREVLESYQFYDSKSKLSIALGRDITGEPIIGDLTKMPHLLVAGATGSGKSVCINGIITSILYKAKPSEVKFLMIDPKVVELNVYNGIPHLLAPVVTNPKKASKALKMIVNEMEKRYEKFAEKGARDIERYNEVIRSESIEQEIQLEYLPYIVVIIDELADLMMVAPHDVEDAIIRLAQKARAAGIHLIVATQRPSVDVITGLIKANIPSRIAFGVSSQIDSRTILDTGGAEKLLGRGDMLYLPVGYSKPIRIQGAFISDVEVEEVVSFVKDQQTVKYHEEIVPELNQPVETETFEDDLFSEAVKIVVETNQASVSLLQRKLRIGYTRAARLIDEMEAKGIVGPYEGSKPRKVLLSNEQIQKIIS